MTDIIDLALACYRRPLDYQDRFSLTAPLPEGIDRLLWLANGSPEVLEAAIRQTGAQPQELRDAARFCIQQWCLVRGADPYRVLGVTPDVPPEKIKEHYRLLMRLFHPDRAAGQKTWTDHYASRVTEAWTALSRLQDRAAPDSQSCPPYVPIQDAIRPVAERAAERPGSLANRYRPEQRLRARRRWAPHLLVWSGLMLVTITVLSGFYLERFSVSRVGFEPASAVDSSPSSNAAMVQAPVAAPADLGALGPLLAAPDWQALERREQQAQRQAAQLQEQRAQWEQTRRQQLVAEEALLESMREERTRLEQQVKTEQAKIEQVQAERLAAEQQRLTRLRAEQARVEQARTERELAEQRRLEALQAEQAKTERLAQELRAERQRLEKLKAEQARAEQAKSEHAKIEQMQIERQRLEEQLKAERARAEQAKSEHAKIEQMQIERQRLEEQLKAERARAEQARRAAAINRAPATLMSVTAGAGEQDLTAGELESLMNRYAQAYQRGDLSGVMALFTANARGRIQRDYTTLFTNHAIRGFWLRDLRWAYRGQSASSSGRYELQLQRRDNGEQRQIEGRIRFTVQKRNGRVLIEAIQYDWHGS
ncbi:MAG TPA: DnaJ domain-containing protein [Candidatus Contendobacter sp.]|nr:DnaJ domain-containing protein [Candidatus Contendobacter sp.]